MKFINGDCVEVHIKSIDRWRPATVLTTYPGHGGHMVITDGGQRLHAKRGDLRAIGEGERTITPDPHDTAYQGEVGDHQPQYTDNGDGTGTVSIEIFPKLRTRFIGRDEYRHLKSYADGILNRDPNYGRDTKGIFTKPRNIEPGINTPPNPVVSLSDIHKSLDTEEVRSFLAKARENELRPSKYGHVAKTDELSMQTPCIGAPFGMLDAGLIRATSVTSTDTPHSRDESLHAIAHEYRGTR